MFDFNRKVLFGDDDVVFFWGVLRAKPRNGRCLNFIFSGAALFLLV